MRRFLSYLPIFLTICLLVACGSAEMDSPMTLSVTNGATGSGHDKTADDPGSDNSKGDNGILGSHVGREPLMPINKASDAPPAPNPPSSQLLPSSDRTAIPIE